MKMQRRIDFMLSDNLKILNTCTMKTQAACCTSGRHIMHSANTFLEYSRFYQIILNEQKC